MEEEDGPKRGAVSKIQTQAKNNGRRITFNAAPASLVFAAAKNIAAERDSGMGLLRKDDEGKKEERSMRETHTADKKQQCGVRKNAICILHIAACI